MYNKNNYTRKRFERPSNVGYVNDAFESYRQHSEFLSYCLTPYKTCFEFTIFFKIIGISGGNMNHELFGSTSVFRILIFPGESWLMFNCGTHLSCFAAFSNPPGRFLIRSYPDYFISYICFLAGQVLWPN